MSRLLRYDRLSEELLSNPFSSATPCGTYTTMQASVAMTPRLPGSSETR